MATAMEPSVRLTSRMRMRLMGLDSKRERTRSRVSVTSGDMVDDGLGTTWPGVKSEAINIVTILEGGKLI